MIDSYDDLTSLGQIIYSSYEKGKITATTVQLYVTKGKITQEEADFIINSFPQR
ncbi:MAG TPA: hypothetical protein VN372_03750 [Methanospirillum sp.]|nr:hypothetical protein [Methanospirillum sp.]